MINLIYTKLNVNKIRENGATKIFIIIYFNSILLRGLKIFIIIYFNSILCGD
jgi:hypothetical protein